MSDLFINAIMIIIRRGAKRLQRKRADVNWPVPDFPHQNAQSFCFCEFWLNNHNIQLLSYFNEFSQLFEIKVVLFLSYPCAIVFLFFSFSPSKSKALFTTIFGEYELAKTHMSLLFIWTKVKYDTRSFINLNQNWQCIV